MPNKPAPRGKSRPTKAAAFPSWLSDAVFYQIYPQSFADSNGDGIGDLPGLIGKLDYLQSLGINAIWLNPLFDSPFKDAGYDVRDFCRIAPRYGTFADAKRLFREAHRRGIRVVLDLVAGHTSIEHPWFQASAKPERNRYSDYYIWSSNIWDKPKEGTWIGGEAQRDGNFLINFFARQPALNYGYAKPDPKQPWQQPMSAPGPRAVREEMKRIMRHWLDAGCDGFRVDMASSLVRGDADGAGLLSLWSDFRQWLAGVNPEAVLVSEWGNPRKSITAGFHIDFMLHFGEPAYNALFGTWNKVIGGRREPRVFFERDGGGDIRAFLDNFLEHFQSTRGRGFIALPTGNHDYPRLTRGRTPDELRAAHTLLLTLPTVPFIYYGDEIGMRYLEDLPSKEGSYCNRTGSRTPMQWSGGRTAGFSTASPGKLYLPVDPDAERPQVAAEEADPGSHFHFVRSLLALRRENPALGVRGDFRPIFAEQGRYPFVYERSLEGARWWVAINPCNRHARLDLPAPIGVTALGAGLAHRAMIALRSGQLHLRMKGRSCCVVPLQA